MLTRRQHLLLFAPLALILIPFLFWPMLFGFAASFTNFAPFRANIHGVGLENYARILGDDTFWLSVGNIIVLTVVSVTLEMAVGLAAAYLLRRPFRGRGAIRFILLIPWLIGPVATGVMWHYLFSQQVGLLNLIPAILGWERLPYPLTISTAFAAVIFVEVWRKFPLVSFLALPGLLAIPPEQWDYATLEGVPTWGKIRHIVLPQLRLLLLSITLLLIGDALGTSESVLRLTGGGPGSMTMTPGLYSYNKAIVSNNWTAGATSGWLIVPAVLLVGLCYLALVRREVT